MQLKTEIYYKQKLEENEKYIDRLLKSNEYLSHVVHRDNHLMNALEFSIHQYLKSNDEADKEKLLNEMMTLSKERGDLMRKEQSETKIFPSTGSALIDGAINSMYVKAAAHGIDFNLIVSEKVNYLINNFISQTELETLLCDHIKDAIIAIDAAENSNGKILVSIAMSDGILEIAVSDNGVEFMPETLAQLGIKRVTTHAEQGGSGIGFMTTFKTLENAGASLMIIEHESKHPFSKSVKFRFDGKNQFIVSSYRKNLLEQLIDREDVVLR